MFQKLIKFSIQNKLLIASLTVALIVWGGYNLSHLPFDSTPDITNNQVQVITQAPSLGAQEVEQNISAPIEMALSNIPNTIERRSISRSGLSVVTLVFKDETDIYWARQQVSQQIKEAEEMLPKGNTSISLAPISTGLGEIYQYTIRVKIGYENRYNLTELRSIQDWIVRKQLSGTPGVAEVSGWGGFVKQYEVAVNTDQLIASGITIPEIFNALSEGNENTGGSYIERNSNQYFIRGLGKVKSLEDIKRIPIKTTMGTPVLVGDVADVRIGHATRYGAVTRNGEGEVVAGITLMLKGENFQEVIKNVKKRIEEINKTLPEGVVIEPYIDRTQLVNRVTSTIARNLIEGGIIVVFILILFLGNYRAGLIVASVIPLSMLFAFGMMRICGISGNLMSLGAIDFGIIVDGAVIIVEAVCAHVAQRHLQPSGVAMSQKEMDREVFFSASKIRKSSSFGEIIIMTVYLPLLTLVGIEGKMFRPMALTIFFAILGSFILSLTYVPMASALFLSKKRTDKPLFADRLMKRLQRIYRPILEKSLVWSKGIISLMVVIFLGSLFLFSKLGGEFLPNLEEGDFAAELSMSQGTSLSQMIKTTTLAEKILRKQFPEIKQAVTRIGSAEIPTDPMPVERADMLIALKPKAEWTSAKTKDELIAKMEDALKAIPGLETEITQPIQMRNNELITGIRQDVAIKIYGNDLSTLTAKAQQVAKLIKNIDGVTSPIVEKVQGLPQIQVTYNRDQMAQYGISVQTANQVLEAAFAGKTAGNIFENDRRYDLVVKLDDNLRNDDASLKNLAIPLPNEQGSIPLSQIADISYKDAPAQIAHEDGERRIYVGFNVRGRDIQSTVTDVERLLNKQLALPSGYYYTFGGEFQNLKEATDRLLVAVPLALVLILCLLFATLKSFKETLFVFSAIPLSAIGGIGALWLRGMPFSISAGVGFIALFGVAVLNGIVLVGQFNNLEHEGVTDIRKRIVKGCMMRLRPVIMTALVASLGFLPMALSHGDGAEVQRPLATVVIGGLISATLLTLIVLPAIYKTFSQKMPLSWLKNILKKKRCSSFKLLLAALLLTINLPSKAQEQTLSLKECIDLTTRNNYNIRIGKTSVEQTHCLEKTAFELPKTNVKLSQDLTGGGSPDNGISISQEFELPTVYKAKREQLKSETSLEESRLSISRQELTKEVTSCYYTAVYKKNKIVLLQEQDSIYHLFLELATNKYQGGETSLLEQMNAKKLYEENLIELKKAKNDYRIAQIELQQLTNTNAPIAPTEKELQPLLYEKGKNLNDFSKTPTGNYWQEQRELETNQLKVLKASFLPTFNVGLTGQLVIKGINPYNIDRSRFTKGDFMGFEIGINIPLTWGAQKARTKALHKKMEMTQLQEQKAMQDRQFSYEIVSQKSIEAKRAMEYYEKNGIQQARNIASTSKIAYENGEIGYIEYIQNLEVAIFSQLKYLDAINEYNQNIIILNYLQGIQ